MVDFSFVYDELKDKYCHDNGRNAIDPIRMFKYLLLKSIYDLSDVDLVERLKYDMSFKYFLHMAPEEPVIEPSSLTKFRRLHLKDVNFLDLLINKPLKLRLKRKSSKVNPLSSMPPIRKPDIIKWLLKRSLWTVPKNWEKLSIKLMKIWKWSSLPKQQRMFLRMKLRIPKSSLTWLKRKKVFLRTQK